MAQFGMSIDINASKEDLWPWLTDGEKVMQWMDGLIEVTPTTEGGPRVGATSTMKIKEGRKVHEYHDRITAFEPHEHFAIELWGGCFPEGMSMQADYRLSAAAQGGTHIDYLCSWEAKGFMWKLMGPVGKLFAKFQQRKFFSNLKRIVESDRSVAATA